MIAIFLNLIFGSVFIGIGGVCGMHDRHLDISRVKFIIYTVLLFIWLFATNPIAIGFNINFILFLTVCFNIGFWICYKDFFSECIGDLYFGNMKNGTIFMVSILAIWFLSSSQYIRSEAFKDLGNIEVNVLKSDQIDDYYSNIKQNENEMTPINTAFKIAKLKLSEKTKEMTALGSIFHIDGDLHSFQKINDNYYHVFALVYNNFSSQGSYGGIDKYILVDGYDINKGAILVESGKNGIPLFSMDISYGGSLLNNVIKKYRNKYLTSDYSNTSLVIDDNFKPYLAFYNVKASIGLESYVNTELALFDFESNSFTSFKKDDIPEWIDYKISYKTFIENFNVWSGLKNEFKDRHTSKLIMDYSEKVVQTKDGASIVSHVSTGVENSNELVYLAFINIKTNKVTLIESYGLNKTAIEDNIKTELSNLSEYRTFGASNLVILENNEKAWITPILSSDNWKITGWAVSHPENVNKIYIAETLKDAKENYILMLK